MNINGIPVNGYQIRDTRYPSGTFPQHTLVQFGKTASALVDLQTIWPQGSKGTITIVFDPNQSGAYSFVGKLSSFGSFDPNNPNGPSMSYGFLDPPIDPNGFDWNGVNFPLSLYKFDHRNGCFSGTTNCESNFKPGAVILHEFMHSLGGAHEHQNTVNNPLKLNIGAIYASYCDGRCDGPTQNPPDNSQCKQEADFNVLSKFTCFDQSLDDIFSAECFSHSEYDPDSILLYPMYDCWMAENFKNPTKNNYRLSESDKAWLAEFYPKSSNRKPLIEVTFKNGEEWQKAWVQKMVTEDLAPFVGVNFVWPGMPLENPPIPETSSVETTSSAEPPPPLTKGGTFLTENNLLIIVIVVGIILLFFLFFYLKK